MRKLSVVALVAGLCMLGISGAASATSVNLVWTGATSGTINGSAVEVSGTANATLTLDVQMDVDSRGVAGWFVTFDFDTDLGNELNIVSFEEISWTKINKKGVTTKTLLPLAPGVQSTQESTGAQAGFMFEFDGATLGDGPTNSTLTFARLVFSTNAAAVATDGDDIFSSGVVGCNALGCDISTEQGLFNGAAVNLVPEPGATSLLLLSVGGLLVTGRRGRR